MKITPLELDGLFLCEPLRHGDARGWFMESYRQDKLDAAVGRAVRFVQDNRSMSSERGTLRGLHYQAPPFAQDKLVQCVDGKILDVVVDARRSSSTFGQGSTLELSSETAQQLFVPAGFLHGFVTLTENAQIAYKVTAPYDTDSDGSVHWNSVDVDWGFDADPKVSDKDRVAPLFSDWVSPFD
jgi:dTDP-4-dehydrorhamnose 3,5-epimerase